MYHILFEVGCCYYGSVVEIEIVLGKKEEEEEVLARSELDKRWE